jgi:hypothetical protein
LRQLLLNRQEEHRVRVEAFLALREWRVGLPAGELEQLLADPALTQDETCFCFDHEFLPLCRSEEGQAIARRYLTDPRLRVRSTASLVRRGEEWRLSEIVREATGARKVAVRATALAELGRLDAEVHLPLLRHALLHDHPRPRGFACGSEAASAAAVALARLGTTEAMTTLLQACLPVDPNRMSRFSPCDLLVRVVRQPDGIDDPRLELWASYAW